MRAKPVVDCYFYPQQHYLYASKLHLFGLFLFYTCYPFHCIECNNFVVWFAIWSSLIAITDEGRNPKQDGSGLIIICIVVFVFLEFNLANSICLVFFSFTPVILFTVLNAQTPN